MKFVVTSNKGGKGLKRQILPFPTLFFEIVEELNSALRVGHMLLLHSFKSIV